MKKAYPELLYVSEGNVPSMAANSIQVMKMSQAFAKALPSFELVTLGDLSSWIRQERFDFWTWYGVQHPFPITRLPLLWHASYPFPQYYRLRRFAKWAALYACWRQPRILYTRLGDVARYALLLGHNVLLETHAPASAHSSWLLHLANERAPGNLLGIITISPFLADSYVAIGVPRERVIVAFDAVDMERFDQEVSKGIARSSLNLPVSAHIAVYAGHLYENWGIESIFALAKRIPEVLFVLVGGWEADVEQRRHEAEQQGLQNVRMVGFVPNARVPTYLAAADVLLMPYSKDAGTARWISPMKLFEYMAAKRPILASSLPTASICQVLRENQNALLVPPDDVKALAEALTALLQDPSLRDRLALQAYEDAKAYTWDRRAETILQFSEKRLAEVCASPDNLRKAAVSWIGNRLKKGTAKARQSAYKIVGGPAIWLSEALHGPYPRVFHHNKPQSGMGGPSVKVNRMDEYFPNHPVNYNIIYSISARIPARTCRRAQAKGVRVVCHVNSVFIPSYRTDYAELNAPVSEVYHLADHIVYGSNYAKMGAERYLGAVNAPYTIVYNAVSTDHFRPSEARNPTRFHVLAAGIHYIRHRLEPLIQAMPHVLQRYPQARLLIAGPLCSGEGIFDCGPLSIRRIIDEVGLEQVEFIASYTQAEAPTVYAQGDVLVHLKDMDWTPNTVIEAMACGLPIVHTGNGGMNELAGEAGISLHLPFDWDRIHTADPAALAERIIEAYEKRQGLSKTAREIAVERYNIRSWVKVHREIFQSLLSRR
jgi:glycosyltransferase involved in cell wall biosynthesis